MTPHFNKKMSSLLIIGSIIITSSIILLSQPSYIIPISDEGSSVNSLDRQMLHLDEKNPIKIGIIHSLSGTMAISETSVVDSTLLAIEEINEKGGILGRKMIPIIIDGHSNANTFAYESEWLIVEEKVDVVFGGWTSASRKAMKPIFEKYDHLLFYPVQYEGLEQSPNIMYTGAAPNQQVLPAVDWAFQNIGTKFFLVGSDYVFPRSANEIIKAKIDEIGGQTVGEEYKLLGENQFEDVVKKIVETKPDVILNTINGDSNIGFFKELRKQGITPSIIPTISFSIAEDEIRHLGADAMTGDYAAWNYFQSIDSDENMKFVNNFKKKYGLDRVTDDPMEAGYVGVYLYAKAVDIAGTTNLDDVKKYLRGITFSAPEGIVGIDPDNQHLAKIVRVGQILPTGQFKIIFSTEEPIHPIPYPTYKSKEEWDKFLNNMYTEWDQNWSNPGYGDDKK